MIHPLLDAPFVKMNGLGNEILVLDLRRHSAPVEPADARALNRDALAFDQMMVIRPPGRPQDDARVDIFNNDGTRAGACGNGTRCVAYVMLEDATGTDLRLDIEGTDVHCRRDGPTRFTIDMGAPRFGWRDIPLARPGDTAAYDLGRVTDEAGLPRPAMVSMGNPHAVFFVPDADAVDVDRLGPLLEHHPAFPDRANISFATVDGPERIRLHVWERGAGRTRACGSAACATLVAAARAGHTGRRATIRLPGGDLDIVWGADDHLLMSGPVEVECRGLIDAARLALAA